MVKVSELRSADVVRRERGESDPEYAAESDRVRLAGDIAAAVVSHRAARGWTQAQMAEQLDWQQPTIARLERGDHTPSLATITRLAREGVLSVQIGRNGAEVEARLSTA